MEVGKHLGKAAKMCRFRRRSVTGIIWQGSDGDNKPKPFSPLSWHKVSLHAISEAEASKQ